MSVRGVAEGRPLRDRRRPESGAGPAARRPRPGGWPLLSLGALVLLAGCGETELATERVTVPDASLQSVANLPDANQEADIVVEGGAFSVPELILLEDEPTVLRVVNLDGEPYRFRIVETLVKVTELPANTAVDVAFTTPNANVYEGQLLSPDDEAVLDTMVVTVQAPGGVQP